MDDKTTGTLTSILGSTKPGEIDDYLRENEKSLAAGKRPFSDYMRGLLREKNIRQQTVFLRADISEGYGYKLLSEEKHTRRRDVILRLCLASHCTLMEVQRALRLCGMSPLYPRIPRDAALIIAFNRGIYEIADVNEFLRSHNMEALSGGSAEDADGVS